MMGRLAVSEMTWGPAPEIPKMIRSGPGSLFALLMASLREQVAKALHTVKHSLGGATVSSVISTQMSPASRLFRGMMVKKRRRKKRAGKKRKGVFI
jgi:hypothetical protein